MNPPIRRLHLAVWLSLPSPVIAATQKLAEQITEQTVRLNAIDNSQIIQGVVIVMLGIYTFITNRHQATQDKVDALEQRLLDKQEAHGERISRVEQALSTLATHRDLNAITTNIAALSAQMESFLEAQKVMREHLETSLRPLERMQGMLTQHQLDKETAATTRKRRRPVK